MKIFIAGICGTFMAGIAQIAQSRGYAVSGCDANVYPPMSEVLANAGIDVFEDYDPGHISPDIDCVVIGNALSRGNPLVEHVLAKRMRYLSGPEWLKEAVLRHRKVIAVAGTHGKTSTASMVAWILESAGLSPGFLIGGKPGNFEQSARLGSGDYFVIEADEYDTAFFDKRSKFVHYLPHIAVLNNLEFDHADIFDNLAQIQRQFHHLIRIVPQDGRIVVNKDEPALQTVLSAGSWSPVIEFSIDDRSASWFAKDQSGNGSAFSVSADRQPVADVDWQCIGKHNIYNALAAIAAAAQVGVAADDSAAALGNFVASARRLELLADTPSTLLFLDFAHHPTAIRTTLEALRASHPERYLLAVIEPRSNTMQMGHHGNKLATAVAAADECIFYAPAGMAWNPADLEGDIPISSFSESAPLIEAVVTKTAAERCADGCVVIAMSNGGFDRIPQKIADQLALDNPAKTAD